MQDNQTQPAAQNAPAVVKYQGPTPGPWFISNNGKLPIHVAAKDSRWKGQPGTLLAEVGGNLAVGTGDFQEDLANAHLIAAAPDMLSTLKILVAQILDYERVNNLSPNPGRKYCWDSVEVAVAVIAKATGASDA